MTIAGEFSTDHRGRRGRLRTNRLTRITGQFIPYRAEMLQSPAYAELSLSGHRILARVAIEHCAHGGVENGKLPVTHKDFMEYGIDKHAVGPAIRECCALGLLEVTEQGFSGAGIRRASRYRLTFLSASRNPATDEWKKIISREDARALAKTAREPMRRKEACRVGENSTQPGWGSHTNAA